MPTKNVRDRSLVRMLGFLDSKQLKGFREYLNCGLFNTNPSLIALYDCIREKVLVKQPEFISGADLLEGTGIQTGLLDKLCSLLMRQLRSFVPLWYKNQNNSSDFPFALEAWREMGLDGDLLEREYRRMKRSLEKMPAAEFGQVTEFQLEHVYVKYNALLPRKDQKELFKPAVDLLDDFFTVTKLKYLCAMISLDMVLQQDREVENPSFSVDMVKKMSALGVAYHKAYLLLNQGTPEPGKVRELLEFVEVHGPSFSRNDQGSLLGYLMNISIRGLSSQEHEFEQLSNDIYDVLLNHGLLVEGGRIAGYHFKNIVSCKLRIGALTEAKSFIESYKDHLSGKNRETLLPYSRGQLAFASLDFREAVRWFRLVVAQVSSDLIIGVEARKMLWKSLFELYDELELDEYHEMVRLYDSFRTYIARNSQLSADLKEGYENFIRIFNRLIGMGQGPTAFSSLERLQSLYMETKRSEKVSYKKWLLGAIQRRIQVQKQ